MGGIVRGVRPLIAAQIHEAVREVVSEAFKEIKIPRPRFLRVLFVRFGSGYSHDNHAAGSFTITASSQNVGLNLAHR